MPSTILQKLLEQSSAVTASGPWRFLAPSAGMRKFALADAAAMDQLCEGSSPEQLEAARVLVRDQGDQLQLNPTLVGDDAWGLFLRPAKSGVPFDIVNHNGSLATDDPPAFECVRDYFTQSWANKTKVVLVANSDDDLAVLRMLWIPCTPAAGLATMSGDQLRRLYEDAPGFPSNGSSQRQAIAVVSGDYRLVLSGLHVAELKNKMPGGVSSIVERLVKAEDVFGFDSSHRVGIWQPDERDFSRICSAAEFQDRTLARKLIWQSVSRSTCSPRQFQDRIASRNAKDYDSARRELLRTLARARELGFHSPEVAKSLEAFNRSFDKGVVDAIIRDAMSATDSVDRSLLLAAAELMGHWHTSSTLVRSIRDGDIGRDRSREELHPGELKERLRVVDGLVKIHRELTRNK